MFKRAVKAAEVTKLVQETLGGDKKKNVYYLNQKHMDSRIKRESGNRISQVQVSSGEKRRQKNEHISFTATRV